MMRSALLALAIATLTACSFSPLRDGPPARDKSPTSTPRTPQPEPRSRSGNPAFYDVYGVRYHVLPSAAGYRERGVASWYGKKFHGRLTSSGEVYDMHAVSAAHKTLPLPTWVRVTNLANGRSLVLRVNDRGPFVDNRLIDLSYAAARELDLLQAGTGLVEVEAISFDGAAPAAATTAAPAPSDALFMQVGAFSDADNARRQRNRVAELGIADVFVVSETGAREDLHRVRIGPIDGVAAYDRLTAQLAAIGIRDARLVSEPAGN